MKDDARRTGPAVEAHYQLLNWLMPTIARFPREQRFLLGDRIQATALDVLEALSEKLGAPYVRYVDDFALFHDDPGVLGEWRGRIERYLEGRRLKLHPRKTVILPTSKPAAFLGFELHAGPRQHAGDKSGRGQRRLPEDNVTRFRNRLRGLRDRWRAGTVTRADVDARIGSWIAHADHADTFWLRQAMFEDGWFEPVPGMR